MANSNPGSKADTAVKLVMIFFICLLSFSVGTYVGKEFSDSDNRRMALEYEFDGTRSPASASDSEELNQAATSPIKEEEIKSLKEEFVRAQRDQKAPSAAKEDSTETASTEKEDGYTPRGRTQATATAKPQPAEKTAPAKAAKRVSEEKAPTADPKPKRKPSSILPSVASSAVGKFTVQVASYSAEGEARNHAAQLKDNGYSAFYVPAEVNGKTWYRVSVGLFSDQQSAMSYRKELLDTQTVSSAIVQKIIQ